MKLIFRKPAKNERDKLGRFLVLLKNDYIPPFTDDERNDELKNIYEGREKAIVAITDKGSMVGYLVWKSHHKDKKYGYIANVCVHPSFRRKGISMKLRKMAFAQIKRAGFRGVYTMTWHKNTRMIESNQKLGMKVVEVFLDEKFRGPGGITIIFRKDF